MSEVDHPVPTEGMLIHEARPVVESESVTVAVQHARLASAKGDAPLAAHPRVRVRIGGVRDSVAHEVRAVIQRDRLAMLVPEPVHGPLVRARPLPRGVERRIDRLEKGHEGARVPRDEATVQEAGCGAALARFQGGQEIHQIGH